MLSDVVRLLPVRLGRLYRHLLHLPGYLKSHRLHGVLLRPFPRFMLWVGELVFFLLDLLGIPEWYELGNCWFKPNSRSLTVEEKQLARYIFGDWLSLERIQLDERARVGPRQYQFCYVSFSIINSWETMPPSVLVHELVHVWQFQHYGSPYILRALLAQRTLMGYNYGGIPLLEQAKTADRGLKAFNYEQQAAIIEDYFRLIRTGLARWSPNGGKSHLETYQYYIDKLKNP
ncbi:hypothetical protein CRP01_05600 [Flavilitoribacter nigricans DSM 23189 = NBRC 102662]|uniref:DUF4157 domain-containing protein n=1 Tax=Flavilitoribacter nigricans (strain ATCC 23147 / DSM 23189 / NBRC 102662 / NCIMB 1420 / SS-2) TaxID=1122177 RepID=A0A2D0NGR4_FLAN2|nr:hypothetical protein CRP01_05600 [Flavilitoribacter nigricans DSM 23189 = NBRC 102662]